MKAFHPNYEELLAAFRDVQSKLARLPTGESVGTPPGVVEFPYVIEDTGESYNLKPLDVAMGEIEEYEPSSPGFHTRFSRIHFLVCPMPFVGEGNRIEGPEFGTLAETYLFQAWADMGGGSSEEIDALTAAVETLRDQLAKLKKWKASAGRKARRFGT